MNAGFISLLLGYLLGSVPFGLILTRLSGAGDIRAIGSGNIGATNVLRTGRKGLAAATLLLDMGKGAGAVLAGGFVCRQLVHRGGVPYLEARNSRQSYPEQIADDQTEIWGVVRAGVRDYQR